MLTERRTIVIAGRLVTSRGPILIIRERNSYFVETENVDCENGVRKLA